MINPRYSRGSFWYNKINARIMIFFDFDVASYNMEQEIID